MRVLWSWLLFFFMIAVILYIGIAEEEEERYMKASACKNFGCTEHNNWILYEQPIKSIEQTDCTTR